jgi:hypothetical protein
MTDRLCEMGDVGEMIEAFESSQKRQAALVLHQFWIGRRIVRLARMAHKVLPRNPALAAGPEGEKI